MVRLIKYIFSVIFALVTFGIAFYYRHEMIAAIFTVDLFWVAIGFVCILSNYFFRALRLKLLTGDLLAVWPNGLYCTSMHGFASYMLPLRTGDLSLPFLLRATIKLDLKYGAVILYKARLLEIFTLGIWISLAALIPFSTLPKSVTISMFIMGVIMILAPFSIHQILNRLHLPFEQVRRIANHLAQASQMTIREIVLTFGIWASIAFCVGCIAKAMQLPISHTDVAFLIAVQLVMQLMPVQGFANSGNHESGWGGALVLMGFPGDMALRFALTSHIIILIYVLLLGLIASMLRFTYYNAN